MGYSSGGDAKARTNLPELLELERRVGDPGELAAETTVDERRLTADIRAVALGAPGLRSSEKSLGRPLQGVLGRETDDGGGSLRGLPFRAFRLRQLHGRGSL